MTRYRKKPIGGGGGFLALRLTASMKVTRRGSRTGCR